MKILRIYQRLPPKIGGMEKHIYFLTKEQLKAGVEVDLFFCQGEKIRDSDVQFNFFNYSKVKPQFLANFFFYTHILLYCALKRSNYDVVHIHGDWSAFLFSKLLRFITSSKIVLGSFHGKLKVKKLKWFKFAYKQLDMIYATGREEQKLLEDRLSIPVYWVHSGVNSMFYTSDKARKVIDVITVANCLPVKNIDLLLDIAYNLPQYNFIHVGGGDFAHYAKIARDRGLHNIEFKGSLNAVAVADLMASSRVFLLTSKEEGTPTVILEALVSGCYVVSSNCCDFTGIINEENGYVCRDFSASSFSSIIQRRIEQGYLGKTMVADYSHFSWSNIARRITHFLAESLQFQKRK